MGDDFDPLTQDFTLTRDMPEQCFNATIIDDEILEIQENFAAILEARGPLPQEASLGIIEAVVDIFDNERESVYNF